MREAEALGVQTVASAAAVAQAADIILVSVINTAAVEDVATGPRGVTANDIAGKVVVDLSTTEIKATLRIAERLQQAGAMFVDAPVSGGPGAAETGTLAIMAGGPDAAIARIAPVMAQLGQMTHMGGAGAGQATKLVNQTIVLTNYCVLAEALRLGEAYGVDTRKIAQALAPGHAGSNLMPVAAAAHDRGGFRAARLCAPGAEGPRNAAGGRRGPARRDADGRAGADALPAALRQRAERARRQRGGDALSAPRLIARFGSGWALPGIV